MANEAVIVELLGNKGTPVKYNVLDNVGIAKGALMYLSADARTAAASTAEGQSFVGIAVAEKVADDGSTTLAVYTNGIFDLVATTSMTLGTMCKLAGANIIETADEAGANATAEHVGLVLETAAGSETIQIKVNK